jgi:hypothetical protein
MKKNNLTLLLDTSDNENSLKHWISLAKSNSGYFDVSVFWVGDTNHEEFYEEKVSNINHLFIPLPNVIKDLKSLSGDEKKTYANRIIDILILRKDVKDQLTYFLFNNGSLGFLAQNFKQHLNCKIIVYFDRYAWDRIIGNDYDKYFLALAAFDKFVPNARKNTILYNAEEELAMKGADIVVF